MIKNLPPIAGDARYGLNPWIGMIPWSRKWQPTPVFLTGNAYEQRSQEGYSHGVAKNRIDLATNNNILSLLDLKVDEKPMGQRIKRI